MGRKVEWIRTGRGHLVALLMLDGRVFHIVPAHFVKPIRDGYHQLIIEWIDRGILLPDVAEHAL